MKTITFIISLLLVSCTNAHNRNNGEQSMDHRAQTKTYGKSRSMFRVSITGHESDSDTYKLNAEIFPQKQVSQVTLKWKLPDHVQVVEGEREKQLDFSEGGKRQDALAISKESLRSGDQIFLFVYKMEGGERLGVSHGFVYRSDETVNKSDVRQKAQKPPKYFE